jgi:hypothetical protein
MGSGIRTRPGASEGQPADDGLAGSAARQSLALSLSPEWGPRDPSAPWWEAVVYPCVPNRELPAVEPNITASEPDVVPGEKKSGRGGAMKMARLMVALSALAALFLIAGASAKY